MLPLRLAVFTLLAAVAFAQTPPPASPASVLPAVNDTDPSYRLAPGDSVSVNVYAEPDMSASQRLDNSGILRLPMIGEIKLVFTEPRP